MKIVPAVSLITIIEVVAILVGAFSGFIEARRKRMDIVGVFIVAFITAFGGGTVRDILLDKRPCSGSPTRNIQSCCSWWHWWRRPSSSISATSFPSG